MIRQATRQDAGVAAALALQLWPENDLPALTAEMEKRGRKCSQGGRESL